MNAQEDPVVKLRKRVEADMPGLIPSGAAAGTVFRAIDHQIDTRIAGKVNSEHIPWPVQQLLEEVSVLLGRCTENRRYKLELEEKAIGLWLSQNKEEKLNRIRKQLYDSGDSELATSAAQSELSAAIDTQPKIAVATASVREAIAARDPAHPLALARVEGATEIAMRMSPYAADSIGPFAEQQEGNRMAYETEAIRPSMAEWEVRAIANAAQLDQARAKLPVMKERELAEEGRIAVEDDYLVSRKQAASSSGSALNFVERMLEVQEIFDRDFSSLYGRAQAAEVGLRAIFAQHAPVPPINGSGTLTQLLVWLHEQMDLLAKQAERADRVRYAVVLNKVLSSSSWEQLIRGDRVIVSLGGIDAGYGYPVRVMLRGVRLEFSGITTGHAAAATIVAPAVDATDRAEWRTVRIADISSGEACGRTGVSSSRKLMNRPAFAEWGLQLQRAATRSEADLQSSNLTLELDVEVTPL